MNDLKCNIIGLQSTCEAWNRSWAFKVRHEASRVTLSVTEGHQFNTRWFSAFLSLSKTLNAEDPLPGTRNKKDLLCS